MGLMLIGRGSRGNTSSVPPSSIIYNFYSKRNNCEDEVGKEREKVGLNSAVEIGISSIFLGFIFRDGN